jgi:hypothetical protein
MKSRAQPRGQRKSKCGGNLEPTQSGQWCPDRASIPRLRRTVREIPLPSFNSCPTHVSSSSSPAPASSSAAAGPHSRALFAFLSQIQFPNLISVSPAQVAIYSAPDADMSATEEESSCASHVNLRLGEWFLCPTLIHDRFSLFSHRKFPPIGIVGQMIVSLLAKRLIADSASNPAGVPILPAHAVRTESPVRGVPGGRAPGAAPRASAALLVSPNNCVAGSPFSGGSSLYGAPNARKRGFIEGATWKNAN